MKQYDYTGKNRQEILRWQFAGCLGFGGMFPIILVNIISILLIPYSRYPEASWNNMRFSLLCWSMLFLFIGFSIGSFFINYFPTIWIDDDAIYISYFFRFRLRIPWAQVISIKTVRTSPKLILVQARKITPWHIHFSLYYSFSFRPGFLVKETIDGFDELILMIKRNIQNSQ